MQKFTDLHAWKTGLELVKEIYLLSRRFPKEEMYAMTAQIRRSSTSVLANIAEGFGRFTYADKANKYTIARGECTETEALLTIAVALKFITAQQASRAFDLIDQLEKMLSGLIRSSKSRSTSKSP